jgi:hypothetical protein
MPPALRPVVPGCSPRRSRHASPLNLQTQLESYRTKTVDTFLAMPVKLACCAVVPLRSWTCLGMVQFWIFDLRVALILTEF